MSAGAQKPAPGRAAERASPAASRAPATPAFARRFRAWREQHIYSLVSSLGRFFQRPVATFLTVGVMALALALPLGLGLAVANVERLSGSVHESREISVFLKVETPPARVSALQTSLRKRADVASLETRTPEQGLAEFRERTELSAALEMLGENPLPTAFVIQPTDDGAALAAALQAEPDVDLVQHDAAWRKRLAAWLAFASRLAWIVASLLGLGVLLVVGNTIRLDIATRRDEIAVLQQLGATDGFVRRPFIYLGAWYGLVSGLLAVAMLTIAGMALQPALDALVASYSSQFRLRGLDGQEALAVLALATSFGWLGAWLASGHHLRQTRPTDL